MMPFPSDNKSRACTGFTQVEMLAVFFIIAVLAVLLLASVNWAVEKSKAAICVGNLRQIGMDGRRLANDNDGYFPGATNGSVGSTWWYKIGSEDGFKSFNQYMLCPSDKKPIVTTFNYEGQKIEVKFSYRWNQRLGRRGGDGHWLFPQVKLHLIANASVCPMAADWGLDSVLGLINSGSLPSIHKDSGNMLFVDGHVERIILEDGRIPSKIVWTPAF